MVIINRNRGIVAALKIWSSKSNGNLSVTNVFNYLIISDKLCIIVNNHKGSPQFVVVIIVNKQGFTTVCRS